MSLKPKRNKKQHKKPVDDEPEYMKIIRMMKTHDIVETITPAKEVSREQIMLSLKQANKGARRLQSIELDPASIELLPYDREPEKLIIKARVKRAWQEGTWRGDRMTSIPMPLDEMEPRHTFTAQMPYYIDCARDSGLIFDMKPDYYNDVAYYKGNDFFVEFIFEGFRTEEYVRRKISLH